MSDAYCKGGREGAVSEKVQCVRDFDYAPHDVLGSSSVEK